VAKRLSLHRATHVSYVCGLSSGVLEAAHEAAVATVRCGRCASGSAWRHTDSRTRTSPVSMCSIISGRVLSAEIQAATVQVNEDTAAGTAESTALDAAATVWKSNSLRANLTMARYVSAGLMGVQDVLAWAFSPVAGSTSSVPKLVDADEATSTAALECISSLVTALIDQAQVCSTEASIREVLSAGVS